MSVWAHYSNFQLLLMLTGATCFWASALGANQVIKMCISGVSSAFYAGRGHFPGSRGMLTTRFLLIVLAQLLVGTAAQNSIAHALNITQAQLNHGVYLDSGCTRATFKEENLLVNVRKLSQPVRVNGVGGSVFAHCTGDYPLLLQDPGSGECHFCLIRGCLLAPRAPANLLSTNELTAARVAVRCDFGLAVCTNAQRTGNWSVVITDQFPTRNWNRNLTKSYCDLQNNSDSF